MLIFLRDRLFPLAIALVTLTVTTQSAHAAIFHYAIDSDDDSLGTDANGNHIAGGTVYEIYAMAIKDDPDTNSVWIALNANMPIYGSGEGITVINGKPQLCVNGSGGKTCYDVPNGNIGWGDLLLDFSGLGNFKAASDAGKLFAVHFALGNDSLATTLGVFGGVRAISVTTKNAGYPNLRNNNNELAGLGKPAARMGDLSWNDPYYVNYNSTNGSYGNPASWMLTEIGSGTKIGEIAIISREGLVNAGFSSVFLNAGGSQVFGMRFAKSLLPGGDFVATLLTECVNDGIAMVGKLLAPPPPPPPSPEAICSLDPGELNPLHPTQIIDGVKVFDSVPSGQWLDPPGTMGITYIAKGDTKFKAITDFPCGVFPANSTQPIYKRFAVIVNGQVYGSYAKGDTLDFTGISPDGISKFTIAGIKEGGPESLTYDSKEAFSVKLEFNQPTGGLSLTNLFTVEEVQQEISGGKIIGLLPGSNAAAAPEPTTIAGALLAASGLFRMRHRKNRK